SADLELFGEDLNQALLMWSNPQPGATRDFTITADDQKGGVATQRVVLTIGSGSGSGVVDTPPVITSIPTYSVVAGQAYRYQVVATDQDGPITYSVIAPTKPALQSSIN